MLLAAACTISAQSWSLDDAGRSNTGHVIVNGVHLVETRDRQDSADRGVHIVQLELCAVAARKHFDTFVSADNADSLADYINGLPVGSMIVGVTADDPCSQMTDRALFALKKIGVDVTERCGFHVKFAFAALIGQPAATVLKFGAHYEDTVAINITFPTFGTGMMV